MVSLLHNGLNGILADEMVDFSSSVAVFFFESFL
jgi:hypothetical protein